MARRFLSLWFPRLGAERWLRLGAARPERPFATVRPEGGALRLAALGAAAEAEGLRPGVSLATAYAACPGLAVLPADPEGEARLMAAIARAAGRLGVRAAIEAQATLVLDVTRAAPAMGGEEALMARALTEAAAARLSARPGLAGNAAASALLARHGGCAPEGRIAAPGGARAALAPLPVAALELGPAAARRLFRLGVRRIGEIAELPPAAILRYLGAETAARLDALLAEEAEALAAAPEASVVPFAPLPMPVPTRRRA